eukprot:4000296-Amphidinium_carterae.1
MIHGQTHRCGELNHFLQEVVLGRLCIKPGSGFFSMVWLVGGVACWVWPVGGVGLVCWVSGWVACGSGLLRVSGLWGCVSQVMPLKESISYFARKQSKSPDS